MAQEILDPAYDDAVKPVVYESDSLYDYLILNSTHPNVSNWSVAT